MTTLSIDTAKTALLVMDCQNGVLGLLAPEVRRSLLSTLNGVLSASRDSGIPVIYVIVRFRNGHPEVCGRNALFRGVKESGALCEGDQSAEVAQEIAPQAHDIVVTKKRVSAFTGSDLEVILRSQGIETLVLTGVQTLGVIESTARSAADMDYSVVVLKDGCADPDPQAHMAAIDYVLPFSATVVSSDDLVRHLQQGRQA